MMVQELFSRLRLKVDRGSFAQGKGELGRFEKQARTFGSKLKKSLNVGNLAKVAGIYSVGRGLQSAAKDALAFDAALTDIGIASKDSVGPLDELREKVLSVSNETGVAKEEVLALARQFVSVTGDGEGAVKAMDTFAKVMVATTSPAEDVATAAAALNQQLGLTPDQMERAFSIISEAGKRGKVELKDFAGLFATTGANFKQFADSQSVRGLTSVSSALQFVAQNFGSSSEAANGLNSLMQTLPNRAAELKKHAGVDVFNVDENGVKTLKSFSEIVFDIGNSKMATDPEIMSKALGQRKEAKLALSALLDNRDAWFSMARGIEHADNISEDSFRRLNSSAGKMQKRLNAMRNRIADAFSPERIDAMVTAIEKLTDALGFVVDHAKEILATWIAIKAAMLAAGGASAAGGAAAGVAGGAAAGAAKGGGLAAAARFTPPHVLAALAAGAGGFAAGSWFDSATGLSDMLSGTTGSGGKNIAAMELDTIKKATAVTGEVDAAMLADKIRQEAVYRQVYGPGGRPEKPTMVNNWGGITVNSPNADPAEVAKQVKSELDREHREAAAGLGVD